ncbi:MAG: class I SAM-dependent methyltransferase [Bacteroidota bacterium]
MSKVTPDLFEVLHDPQAEAVLTRLYLVALKQGRTMLFHFLPKVFQLLGKGIDWRTEDETFYDDKYIPIHPAQGSFLYMQARALNAKSILDFGISYGIPTIYLAKAAKENSGSSPEQVRGKVITTEYLPHKAATARQNLEAAGLSKYVNIWEGDARETLQKLTTELDLVLLDGPIWYSQSLS